MYESKGMEFLVAVVGELYVRDIYSEICLYMLECLWG